jgi:copper transport protein
MAAGIWLGALASLLMASRRADATHQRIDIDAMTARVSSICAWSVAVILVSGPYTAFERLGWNLKLLSDSAYGRTLLLKLAIATPALILGAYNRYRLVPTVADASVRTQLVRSVTIECLLLVAVMGWSAVLANTPPPH